MKEKVIMSGSRLKIPIARWNTIQESKKLENYWLGGWTTDCGPSFTMQASTSRTSSQPLPRERVVYDYANNCYRVLDEFGILLYSATVPTQPGRPLPLSPSANNSSASGTAT